MIYLHKYASLLCPECRLSCGQYVTFHLFLVAKYIDGVWQLSFHVIGGQNKPSIIESQSFAQHIVGIHYKNSPAISLRLSISLALWQGPQLYHIRTRNCQQKHFGKCNYRRSVPKLLIQGWKSSLRCTGRTVASMKQRRTDVKRTAT